VIVNVFMIFKSMGQRSLPFIKHFLQPVINVAAVCGEVTPSIRELVFGQLGKESESEMSLEISFQFVSFLFLFLSLYRMSKFSRW
jgi:hypothetical protein